MKQYTERLFHDPAKEATMTAESDAMAITDTANWMDVSELGAKWRFKKYRNNQTGKRYVYAAIKEFDLFLYSDADEDLTSPKLYGIFPRPLTFSDSTFTTTHAAETIQDTGHGLLTGDGPVRLSNSGGALPAGFEEDTDYWVIKVDNDNLKLASSQANALAGTAVAITDDGTGTHTMSDYVSPVNPDDRTERLYWALLGALNDDTTINVNAQEAYVERVQHDPLFKYYAVVAGATNTETITAVLVPVETEEV